MNDGPTYSACRKFWGLFRYGKKRGLNSLILSLKGKKCTKLVQPNKNERANNEKKINSIANYFYCKLSVQTKLHKTSVFFA